RLLVRLAGRRVDHLGTGLPQSVQRHRWGTPSKQRPHPWLRKAGLPCQGSGVARVTAACTEPALGRLELAQFLADLDGKGDHTAAPCDCPLDRLVDPPDGIRRELQTPAPIELLDRPDESDASFLAEVGKLQALAAVALSDRDDEAQVRLDHLCLGFLVAGLDTL